MSKKNKQQGPKILLLDIETKPMLSYIWRLFDEQGGIAMLKEDWSILSWAAKWYDPQNKIKYPLMYMDQSKAKDIENEKKILEGMWKLLDEADIVIGHNSDKFDLKKLNARFAIHGMQPPSSYRKIDTLKIARKHFAFSSNKLEYLAEVLGCKLKKLTKRVFSGFDLWRECLARNQKAWAEMQVYNKQDVLVLEEVYKKLIPWDSSINFSVYHDGEEHVCSCGNTSFLKRGLARTNNGVYQRYRCNQCGKESRGKENLLSPEKRKSLKTGTNR